MQLVILLFVLIVNHSVPQLVRVVFKGDWAIVAYHRVPHQNDTCVPSTLVMRDRAVIVNVIDVEAPMTVLPQRAIPFGVVRLFITAFEAVGERGALALVTFVLGDSAQLEAIFALDVAPLILRWSLSSKDTG